MRELPWLANKQMCERKTMVGLNQYLRWICDYFFQYDRVMNINFDEHLLKVFCRSLW